MTRHCLTACLISLLAAATFAPASAQSLQAKSQVLRQPPIPHKGTYSNQAVITKKYATVARQPLPKVSVKIAKPRTTSKPPRAKSSAANQGTILNTSGLQQPTTVPGRRPASSSVVVVK